MLPAAGYLRHSAFRTINGGICSGLIPLFATLLQLLLLGYHRILKSSGFIGIPRFLRLPNIIAPVSFVKISEFITLLSSDRIPPDFTLDARPRTYDPASRAQKGLTLARRPANLGQYRI